MSARKHTNFIKKKMPKKTSKTKSKSQSRREEIQRKPLNVSDLIERVHQFLKDGPVDEVGSLFPSDVQITGVSVHYVHAPNKNKHGTVTFTKKHGA